MIDGGIEVTVIFDLFDSAVAAAGHGDLYCRRCCWRRVDEKLQLRPDNSARIFTSYHQ